MDILPSDLGEERTVALMQMRGLSASGMGGLNSGQATAAAERKEAVPPKRNGIWTRFCTSGTRLSPSAAKDVMHSMKGITGGIAGGLGGSSIGLLAPGLIMLLSGKNSIAVVGTTFLVTGMGLLVTGLFFPRELMTKYAHQPLTASEAESLAQAAGDPTEKAYLNVIAAALRQPDFPSTRTEDDLREALRTLGEAIDKLPRVSAPQLSVSSLQSAAQKAYGEADAETDPIIAASLRRRADAQAKTAQAAQKTELLVRRADALRSEIDAQIQALHVGLSGFDGGFATNAQNQDAAQNAAAHLNQLAQSVQSVAREAGSLLDARDEVATWTEPQVQAAHPALPMRPPAPPDAEVIVLGRTNR